MKKEIISFVIAGLIFAMTCIWWSSVVDREVKKYAKQRSERYGTIKEMPSLQWDRESDCWFGEPFRGSK